MGFQIFWVLYRVNILSIQPAIFAARMPRTTSTGEAETVRRPRKSPALEGNSRASFFLHQSTMHQGVRAPNDHVVGHLTTDLRIGQGY